MGSSRNEEYFTNSNIKTGSFSTMQLFCLLYDTETALFPAFLITGIMPVWCTFHPTDLIDVSRILFINSGVSIDLLPSCLRCRTLSLPLCSRV